MKRALAGGIEAFETDICLTADDELVVLHDPLLSLGTTLSGWAHDHTAAAICAARVRDRGGAVSEDHPLLLSELLELMPPDVLVQLEIKAHADPELAARTARVLCRRLHGERRRLEVISFHSTACATAAARGFRSRLIVWTDNSPEQMASWAVRTGVAGFSIEHFLLSRRLAQVLRGASLSVNTGTINDVELALRVIELAAPDAICTDRPLGLRAELEAAGFDADPGSVRVPAAS